MARRGNTPMRPGNNELGMRVFAAISSEKTYRV
jgi:hypothetical protein